MLMLATHSVHVLRLAIISCPKRGTESVPSIHFWEGR